jgi:hypothetical protein
MCGRHEGLIMLGEPRFAEPPSGRVRVLFEHVDGGERWAAHELLTEAGYEVVTCGGPEAPGEHDCPVLQGEGCAAVCAADVIVTGLSSRWRTGPEILASVRAMHPETPIIVEASPRYTERHSDVLEGCEVIHPLSAHALLDALDRVTGA